MFVLFCDFLSDIKCLVKKIGEERINFEKYRSQHEARYFALSQNKDSLNLEISNLQNQLENKNR